MSLKIPLFRTGLQPCSYLAGQQACNLVADPALSGDAWIASELNRQGFRRSGQFLYQPDCPACSACQAVRIPVGQFRPSRTQQRLGKRNADLCPARLPAIDTAECYALFARYIETRHADGSMYPPNREDFTRFLANPPGDYTVFEGFRDGNGALCAVVVCDRFDDGLSAVFSFYDPGMPARSLGTWMILWLLEQAREQGLPYLYPGFFVAGCRKMEYKRRFRPLEIHRDGEWLPLAETGAPGEAL